MGSISIPCELGGNVGVAVFVITSVGAKVGSAVGVGVIVGVVVGVAVIVIVAVNVGVGIGLAPAEFETKKNIERPRSKSAKSHPAIEIVSFDDDLDE